MEGVIIPLADLGVIILVATLFGRLSRRLGQPAVIGELFAGIALGPSLLNGEITRWVMHPVALPFLETASSLGLISFVFLVGVELKTEKLRSWGKEMAGVSIGSILIPFTLGFALGLSFDIGTDGVSRIAAALFLGLAMSVTAFPVLARIVAERNLTHTVVAQIALTAAAVCDLVAWIGLIPVQSIAAGGGSQWETALIIPFVAVMILVVKPALNRLMRDSSGQVAPPTGERLAILAIGLIASCLVTQALGLHLVFGAFIFGLIQPRELGAGWRRDLNRSFGLGVLLLPVYFVHAGASVDLSNFNYDASVLLVAVVVVAVVGKMAGTAIGARLGGFDWHDSFVLASLMTTRGATELVVLTVGLDSGLINANTYALMVIMTLITTAMAGPLLNLAVRLERSVGPRPRVRTNS